MTDHLRKIAQDDVPRSVVNSQDKVGRYVAGERTIDAAVWRRSLPARSNCPTKPARVSDPATPFLCLAFALTKLPGSATGPQFLQRLLSWDCRFPSPRYSGSAVS